MAAQVAYQARSGFNAQSIAALQANGLDGVRDLINLEPKDVEQNL